jgi:hypothetical protein
MTREASDALEKIITLCCASKNLTSRQLRIYDIAMAGVGMCAGQRRFAMQDLIQAHRDRMQERRDRQAAQEVDHANP